MEWQRFMDEQIAFGLLQVWACQTIAESCRWLGVSVQASTGESRGSARWAWRRCAGLSSLTTRVQS